MRKKDYLAQNLSLFEQLQQANAENAMLRREIERKNEQITQQRETIDALLQKAAVTVPFKRLEEKVNSKASVPPEIEYGSAVIGKIVVKAAHFSNRLTVRGETKYRELVNLILGRTEVAKSEILNITSDQADFSDKKVRIDEQYEQAVEYFNNIMAQRV